MNQADDAGRGAPPKRGIPVIAKSTPVSKTANGVSPPAVPRSQPPPPQPKIEKSLEAVLFDDVGGEPAKATAPRSSGSATTAATRAADGGAASPWPGDVPSLADAEKIVAGLAAPPAASTKVTQDFSAGLTPAERTAFTPGENPARKKLRMALAGRWRLSVALATKPTESAQINTAALDQMLSEVDILLSAIGVEETGDDPQIKEAFGSVRTGLAKNAVDLAEIAFKAHQASAQGAANSAAQKYQKISARIISNSALDAPPMARRQKVMIGVLALAVLGAGGFHGYRFVFAKPPPVPTLPGAPVETYGTTLPGSGGLSMVQNLSGKPLSESDMTVFRNKMEAQGKGVKDMGNGLMFVVPKDSPLLATPNSPNTPGGSQK